MDQHDQLASSLLVAEAASPARHPSRTDTARAKREQLIDQAYNEYCVRREKGEQLDPDAFCARYPSIAQSLRELLTVAWLGERFQADSKSHAADEPDRWPEPGEHFQGFRLERLLGRGSFARVYLASESALGQRKVVVKLSARGAAEAEILGRLKHPHIVPIHSLCADPVSRLSAVCMPYLGSATLDHVLRRIRENTGVPKRATAILDALATADRPDDWPEEAVPARVLRKGSFVAAVVQLGAQLADALAYLHSQKISHRDLKPSNVLLRPDGRPLLLDFNLSGDPLSGRKRMGGTIPYMAPEQLRALLRLEEDAAPDEASADLFSLGVLLYEMLAGKAPFSLPNAERQTETESCLTMLRNQQVGPQSLRQVNAQVDARLSSLIASCLALDPGQRPASAAVLARELRRSQRLPRRLRNWTGRHAAGVAVAVLLAVAGSWAGAYTPANREPSSPQQLQSGEQCYREGRYKEALRFFDEALTANPEAAEVFFARGRAQHRLEDLESAQTDYRRAWDLGKDVRVLRYLCFSLSHNKQHEVAVGYCQMTEKEEYRKGRTADLLNNWGYSLFRGSSDKAASYDTILNLFQEARQLDPGSPEVANNLEVLQIWKSVKEGNTAVPRLKPLQLIDPLRRDEP
jgi:serine/threonine protein kinase